MAKNQFLKDVSNIPNIISILRIVVIVFCVVLFLCDYPVIATSLGLIAGLSDYADGIIARKCNLVTRLGALLDQVSDLLFNFFVISAAVYMGVWPIIILWAWGLRDLGVLSMRASAAQLGFDIPSIYLGKLASAVIYYSLFLMPLDYALNSTNYHNHAFVVEHINEWICFGMHWIPLAGVVVGIVLQWITAVKYVGTYMRKYDEIHANKENEPGAAGEAQTADEPEKASSEPSAE